MTPKPIALKREEAQTRQEAHDTLTTQQKIAKARSRPGNSRKELTRLERRLKQEN